MGASCSSEDAQSGGIYSNDEDHTKSSLDHDDRDVAGIPVHNGPILDLAWSEQSGCMVTCSDDKKICLVDWDKESKMTSISADTATPRSYFNGHVKAVNRLHVNQTSGHVWSVSRDLSLRCWDVRSGLCLRNIEETHELNVSAVASLKQGDKVYTGSRDYHVKGWDVETGKNICDFHTPRNIVTAMKTGVDTTDDATGIPNASSLLFQASEDLSIKVWDVRTSSKTPAIRIGGFVYFGLTLDTSNDGNLIIAGCKGFNGVGCDVKVWDLRNLNEPLGESSEHQQDVTSVRFLSNQRFASCSKDGTVRLWDTQSHGPPKNVATYNSGYKYTSLCRLSDKESGRSSTFAAGSFEGHLELLSCDSANTISCKSAVICQCDEED